MRGWKANDPECLLRILVIEDETDLADLIRLHLSEWHAEITVTPDGAKGLALASGNKWHIIFLDLRLPGIDGLDICRSIRAAGNTVPIMIMSSRGSELERVLGLEVGADDYLPKPFSFLELKARAKALLRRSNERHPADEPGYSQREIVFGPLKIDQPRRLVWLNDKPLHLTAKEFDLLWFFASRPDIVFRRMDLLDKVWGYGHEGYEHTVNSHINRLRCKLEEVSPNQPLIHTVWGVGYRFGWSEEKNLCD